MNPGSVAPGPGSAEEALACGKMLGAWRREDGVLASAQGTPDPWTS